MIGYFVDPTRSINGLISPVESLFRSVVLLGSAYLLYSFSESFQDVEAIIFVDLVKLIMSVSSLILQAISIVALINSCRFFYNCFNAQ